MKYKMEGQEYSVNITRKKNKNTYIRIGENHTIEVTTSYFITKKEIERILKKNETALLKLLVKKRQIEEKQQLFYYLGKKYDIIKMEGMLTLIKDRIFVKDEKALTAWYLKQVKTIAKERLDLLYPKFQEPIPYPILKFRKMKTRWGVCNRKTNSITLNTELLRYDLEKMDYVIIHELSHFVEFNHSKAFWKVVESYCPDYKRIRKELKE